MGRRVKFFAPGSRYTFYVTEFDGEDTLYDWWVSALGADCDEWGYTSLFELAEAAWSGSRRRSRSWTEGLAKLASRLASEPALALAA